MNIEIHLIEAGRNAKACNGFQAFTQRDKTCLADNGGIPGRQNKPARARIEDGDQGLSAVGNASRRFNSETTNHNHKET